MASKACYHCKEVLPLSDYHRDSARPDGYRGTCIDCDKISKHDRLIRRNAKLLRSWKPVELIEEL